MTAINTLTPASTAELFAPLSIRGVTLRNRIGVLRCASMRARMALPPTGT